MLAASRRTLYGLILLILVGVTLPWSYNRVHGAENCQVAGFVQGNWSPSTCGVYSVTDDIVVAQNTTLTIAPGSVIQFRPGTSLEVRGTLIARGGPQISIRFSSSAQNPQPGDWNGLLFTNSSAPAEFDQRGEYVRGSIVQYATIEYAGTSSPSTDVGAVIVECASPFFDHNIIQHNSHSGIAVGCNATNSIRVTNNVIENNGRSGDMLVAHGILSRSSITALSNTIQRNTGRGMWIDSTGFGVNAQVRIEDNQVSFNGDTGLHVVAVSVGSPGAQATISNNTISYNRGQNLGFTGCTGGGIYVNINATITNNFVGGNTAARGGSAICVQSGMIAIHDNDLYGSACPSNDLLHNDTSEAVDASRNYWGTTDEAAIRAMIVDAEDNAQLGTVAFRPYRSGPTTSQVFTGSCAFIPIAQR